MKLNLITESMYDGLEDRTTETDDDFSLTKMIAFEDDGTINPDGPFFICKYATPTNSVFHSFEVDTGEYADSRNREELISLIDKYRNVLQDFLRAHGHKGKEFPVIPFGEMDLFKRMLKFLKLWG